MTYVTAIIPTYKGKDRVDDLMNALIRFKKEGLDEVVVVLDGYDDETFNRLVPWKEKLPLKVLQIEHQSPATARNEGIKNATGEYLWFLGDDSRPEEGCLQELLKASKDRYPVQGSIKYPEEWLEEPFVYFLENVSYSQFSFHSIDKGCINFSSVSTSNLLVPKDLIDNAGLFDPRFKEAIYEDTEWAFRLQKGSGKILFQPTAIVIHEHKPELRIFCNKMILGGYYTQLLSSLHKDAAPYLNLEVFHPLKSMLFNKVTVGVWFRIASLMKRSNSFLFFIYRGLINYHHRLGLKRARKEGIV